MRASSAWCEGQVRRHKARRQVQGRSSKLPQGNWPGPLPGEGRGEEALRLQRLGHVLQIPSSVGKRVRQQVPRSRACSRGVGCVRKTQRGAGSPKWDRGSGQGKVRPGTSGAQKTRAPRRAAWSRAAGHRRQRSEASRPVLGEAGTLCRG